MTDWNSLLDWLAAGPRENGSQALADTALRLFETLRNLGLSPEALPYTAHPYRLRIAGVLILAGAALYARFAREHRWRPALALAVALPCALLLELEAYVPVLGWPGAQTQHHVAAIVPPATGEVERRLIVAAHFDSKTDYLDHVERAPVELLALPVIALMLAAAALGTAGKGWPRLQRGAAIAAYVYGVGAFLAFTGGAFVSARSHGAVDDGAACAVLVRLAERLGDVPLQRTEVELLFLSGEEIGVEGSWALARQRYRQPPPVPTAMINLEGLGTTADLAVLGRESFALRSFQPAPALVAAADAVHRYQRGKPLWVTWYGGGTDARSFLAHDIPAMTLIADPPGHPLQRDLHSAVDTRGLLQNVALQAHLDFLERLLREIETPALSATADRSAP